ncbi:MAG: ADP-forming succinate--CoA ligase subunit beta [Candidatus Neomarinimicrobiota bacterium]
MKIHEYQGKELFRNKGVPVPHGYPAFTTDEALSIYQKLGEKTVVVKAQIHAGGRGKGGGIKIAHSTAEVKKIASTMLGMQLVTHQTGPEGKKVQRLLIEEGIEIKKEFYAGIVLDRGSRQNVFMVSTEGGIEIEKVAKEAPEKIVKLWIDPGTGLQAYQLRALAFGLGLKGAQVKTAVQVLRALWDVYTSYDCSLIEINPLVLTSDDNIIALDSKINFDDNALFRHKELEVLRDLSEEDQAEVEASKYSLNYIKLDGNVGCVVNGAGLAMATMDIIKLSGGEPANFLDVGGVANSETVKSGFKIILTDQNVKAILINIFGGIVRCDRVAQGVIDAMRSVEVNIPVVIRLEGTNSREAARLLKESSFEFIVAGSFQDASLKVVQAAAGL